MRKILLVEDEAILRETYEVILSSDPYIVETAANGLEALDKCQRTRYDLVLLDIMMPVMDGLTFLKELTNAGITDQKVILLTNLSGSHEIEEALKLGAQGTVLKASLSPKQLLTTVRYEVEAA
jgi:CheY-like chemotaxis protein